MKLHFKTFGTDGPPVIILHGLFGSLDNWYTIAKNLSDSYRIYTIDQRNHGRSPHHDSHTYRDLAQDLYFFMHENGIDTTHVIGHSMGGTAAMQFTSDHPDMVEKLIVVDMAPRDYEPRHEEILTALNHIRPDDFSRRKEIDDALSLHLPDNSVRQYILKNIMRTKSGEYRWKFNIKAIRGNYSSIISGPEIVGTILNPTLFIKGERSSYISEKDMIDIKQLFSTVEIKSIPDAGHWTHSDQPDRFLDIVREFLSESV